MYFKDLKNFNLVVFAKQGWKMVQNKEDLLLKVYMTRYFPLGDFFEVKLGQNLSYAWRDIWKARKIHYKGRQ